MADQKETTVVQSIVFSRMVEAKVIRAAPIPETASGVQPVRTVATTLTTGNVSIRYVPRPAQPSASGDTTS